MEDSNDWRGTTALTSIIKRRYTMNSHESIFTYGKRGHGKTTYDLLSSYSFYKNWDSVLKYIFINPEKFFYLLDECYDFEKMKVIKRIPVLIWDDSTVRGMAKRGRDVFLEKLAEYYTMIRDVVGTFIWNGPNPSILTSKLRAIGWLLTFVQNKDKYNAIVRFYNYGEYPNGKPFVQPRFICNRKPYEQFKYTWLPDDVRKRYKVMREGYSCKEYLELKKAYNYEKRKKYTDEEISKRLYQQLSRNIINPEGSISATIKKEI